MTDKLEIVATIGEHNDVCRKILELVEGENRCLRQGRGENQSDAQVADGKRELLSHLERLKDEIKRQREALEEAGLSGANLDQEISSIIEDGKRVIMKTIALDRENEKLLLKSGRLQPGNLPAPEARRPDLVARTYGS
jgi:hypothetical protein